MHTQIEHLFRLDHYAVTLGASATHFDGPFDNEVFEDGLGVTESALWLALLEQSFGVLPFVFEVHASLPDADDVSAYDHVVEASLVVPGQTLSLTDEFHTKQVLTLPEVAGDAWRVRVYYAGRRRGAVDKDTDAVAKHVRIVLFAGAMAPLAVLHAQTPTGERSRKTEPELRAWLEGASLSHRALAAVALLRLGVLEPVRAAMQSASVNAGLRLVVATSLWLAGEPAHLDLVQLTEDADALVRERAARSIGLTENIALRGPLERLVNDPVAAVRDAAHFALGEIDPSYVMPPAAQAPALPTMILCTVSALGEKLSAKARAKYGACPMWYLRTVDQEACGMRIFDEIAEPKANKLVDEVMAVISDLMTDHSDDLHAIVGPDDSLQFGFHSATTLAEARACFAADGYAIVEPGSVPSGVYWPVALAY